LYKKINLVDHFKKLKLAPIPLQSRCYTLYYNRFGIFYSRWLFHKRPTQKNYATKKMRFPFCTKSKSYQRCNLFAEIVCQSISQKPQHKFHKARAPIRLVEAKGRGFGYTEVESASSAKASAIVKSGEKHTRQNIWPPIIGQLACGHA
jgi:hypothetical protein